MKLIYCFLLLLVFVSSAFAQNSPPPPSAPRSVTFPRATEMTLPNGLHVIIIERHNTPLVTAGLVIKNGSEIDPTSLAGVADMTANLLVKGTTTRTATQIAQQAEALGSALGTQAQWDSTTVSLEVMSDKAGPALSLIADVIRHPTFKADEVERLRQQYIDSFTVSADDPPTLARFVAAKVIYGDGLYGHPLQGTLESLKKITRANIVRVHQLYYRPDNAILMIGGDIDQANGFALAKRYFGDWINPGLRMPTLAKISINDQRRIIVVDKEDAGQAAVVVVHRGIDRKDDEYYQGMVANSVLSGYSGRLNQEVRIKRGLSYGAVSSLNPRREVGPFVATAQTKNESGAEVADLLLQEIGRLSSAPPDTTELVPRKASLIGDFSRSLETVDGLVSRVSELALYGLSLDEINRYIERVEAVGGAEVKNFSNMKLNASSAAIIIVGKATAFLPALQKKYGNVEVIPYEELDLNRKTLRKVSTTSR
ncbi:MAG TPA: pitrilysin family protein [Pyrinomonadaceae bacterium]